MALNSQFYETDRYEPACAMTEPCRACRGPRRDAGVRRDVALEPAGASAGAHNVVPCRVLTMGRKLGGGAPMEGESAPHRSAPRQEEEGRSREKGCLDASL